MTPVEAKLHKRVVQAESEIAEAFGSLFQDLLDQGVDVDALAMQVSFSSLPVIPRSWRINVDLRVHGESADKR